MTLKEQDVVLTTKDADGNTIIQMPITRAANVEDLTNTCLPLGGGDVSGNLTVQSKNVVRSVNGAAADANGNVSITIPSAYTLPNATSSTLGGVKIGSNITVSSGTISLTKSDVTTALGYTPLQTSTPSNVSSATVTKSISKNSSFTLPSNAVVVFQYSDSPNNSNSLTYATVNGKKVITGFVSYHGYSNGDSNMSQQVLSNLSMPLPSGTVIKNPSGYVAMTIQYTPI